MPSFRGIEVTLCREVDGSPLAEYPHPDGSSVKLLGGRSFPRSLSPVRLPPPPPPARALPSKADETDLDTLAELVDFESPLPGRTLARATEYGREMTRLGGSRTGFGGSGGGESVSFPDQTGEDFLGRPKKSELGELSGAMMTAMAGGEIVAGLGRGGRREGEGGTGVAPSPALPRYVKGDPITSVYVLSTPQTPFFIKYRIDDMLGKTRYVFFELHIDGTKMGEWGVDLALENQGRTSRSWWATTGGPGLEERKFVFGAAGEGRDGGLIEVHVWRATSRRPRRSSSPVKYFPPDVASGVVAPITTGPSLDPQGGTAYRYLLKDPADIPFAKFKFHYGTWASLRARNLIADRPDVSGAGKKMYGISPRPKLPPPWTSAGTTGPSPSKVMRDDTKDAATPTPAPTQTQAADHRWSTLSLAPSLKQAVDEGSFDSDPVEMATASLVRVLPGQENKDKGKGKAVSDDLATVLEEEEDENEEQTDSSLGQTERSNSEGIGGIIVHRGFTISSWHVTPGSGSGSGAGTGLTTSQWAEPSTVITMIHRGRQSPVASPEAPAMATAQVSGPGTVGRRV